MSRNEELWDTLRQCKAPAYCKNLQVTERGFSKMKVKHLLHAFESLESASTSEQLRCAMGKFADEMGFGNFVYALTIRTPSLKPQQYVLSGYPPEWVERYISKDYFKIDPIVKHAHSSTLPIVWDDS